MAPVAIVAGSGMDLRPLLDRITDEKPFSAFAGLDAGGIAGHPCTFLWGRCGGVPVILQCGRRHLYEGLSFREVTRSIDLLHDFGAATVLLLNAVGALLPELEPGAVVAAAHVRTWPCRRLDVPERLTPELVPECEHRGVYCWMHGPCYETRAEIGALRQLGGAVVGMSAAPELLRCQQLRLRAGILSCVTNSCITPQVLTHEHVLATAQNASAALCAVLRQNLLRL